jgi:hypothetical protein
VRVSVQYFVSCYYCSRKARVTRNYKKVQASKINDCITRVEKAEFGDSGGKPLISSPVE